VRKTVLCVAVTALAMFGITGTSALPAAAAGPCGTNATAPAYKHVIWIFMENHSLGDIIGNTSAPYENSLAAECGLATNYHNITHPSAPNYLAATSGVSMGSLPIFSYLDCNESIVCNMSGSQSIFGQGETVKSYEESMPTSCDTSDSGEYAQRHNPEIYYTSLTTCDADDVPYTELATDLAGNTLPAFSFITPNLIDDMHDGTIAQGDSWLAANLPTILDSSEYTSGSTAVFITFDEGSGGTVGESCAANTTDTSCVVPTFVISPSTPAGARASTLFSHYSLLATTEALLGLPKLGQAASAATLTAAFNL
jgi:hypothetical protein